MRLGLIIGFLLSALSSAPVLAQEVPGVQPIGVVRDDQDLALQAVYATPTPWGDFLPGLASGGAGSGMVVVAIRLDNRYRYTYPCDAGQCQGFAGDVWANIDPSDKQGYLDRLLDALAAAVPDRGAYRVMVVGVAGGPGAFSVIHSEALDQQGERSYEGI